MPKLLLFAVCERVIIDNLNNVSLVGIMQNINVAPRPDAPAVPMPRNAVGPKDWAVASLWKQEAGDVGGAPFVHVLQILWPDKTEFNRNTAEFRFEEGKNHQIAINMTGFPLGQQGDVTVNVWIERNGRKIKQVDPWFVNVVHVPNVRH